MISTILQSFVSCQTAHTPSVCDSMLYSMLHNAKQKILFSFKPQVRLFKADVSNAMSLPSIITALIHW